MQNEEASEPLYATRHRRGSGGKSLLRRRTERILFRSSLDAIAKSPNSRLDLSLVAAKH
jgi:hypothetical protein